MLRHYLSMACRGLVRHKLYSLINVLGLSVALTCVIFVVLFVRYQLSYDEWIPGVQHLYGVELTVRAPGAPPINVGAAPYPLGTAMRTQIPGVTAVTRLLSRSATLAHGSRQFLENQVDFVDVNFFKVIRLPFVQGTAGAALRQPESVVLTESAARKYFGNANPMGRTLTADVDDCPGHGPGCRSESVALRVTGVVRDLPRNSQLSGNAFIPIASRADPMPEAARQNWFASNFFTYLALAPGVSAAAVVAAMPSILDRDVSGLLSKGGIKWRGSQLYSVHLTAFTRVHLSSSHWVGHLTPPGSWHTLYGVIAIGMLILLVACFNFTNLATARAALRTREIGLRRTLGAAGGQLTVQFLVEALFLALLSLLCAAAVAQVLLPLFNSFLRQSIALDYARDWTLDLMLLGIAVAAGLASGLYPALVLARLRPASALQGKGWGSGPSVGLRDLLVLMQFAVSIGLGIAAVVVFRQVNFARNMNLGFDRHNILVIGNGNLKGKGEEAFVQALRANPGVSAAGLSSYLPFGSGFNQANVQLPGSPAQLSFNWTDIGPDYARTYGIALVAGRMLSAVHGADRISDLSADGGRNVLVNVAAARRLGLSAQSAVGRSIVFRHNRVRIAGVLANAKIHGARQAVAPTVYVYDPDTALNVSVRLRPGRISQTVAFIDRTWHAFEPTVAIQRWFLSARFDRLYRSDERQGTVFAVFVAIAIFIACLGLYGLVVFSAERRTKEVVIRKICGARSPQILQLMLWRVSLPVLLANALAWPLAYYYLQRWLQGFADHIWLNPAYFLTGGALALLIAWATVFAHTLRLACTSPVKALRYE